MGTNNFHYRNTSHCFAFAPKPYIDEDTKDEVEPDYEMEYDFFIEDLSEQLREEFKNNFQDGYGNDWHELRSFPSRVIGQVSGYKTYGDMEVGVVITVVVRSGYYEGCCCDWLVEYDTGGSECAQDDLPDKDDIYADFEYYSRMNHGACRMLAAKASSWMESEKERLVERVEKVFKTCTNYELVCLGHASNGETFYLQVE